MEFHPHGLIDEALQLPVDVLSPLAHQTGGFWAMLALPFSQHPRPQKNLLEECHYDIMSWVFSNPGLAGHQFPAEVWCSTRTGPWSAASRPLPYPWCHRARGRVMCLHQRRTGIQLYQGLEGHHTYVFSDGLCCTSSLMSLVVW